MIYAVVDFCCLPITHITKYISDSRLNRPESGTLLLATSLLLEKWFPLQVERAHILLLPSDAA